MSSFGVPQREEWNDDPRAWRTLAACRGEDPMIFFPEAIGTRLPNSKAPEYDKARSYCSKCPVRDDCLEFALSMNETEGMYGNRTPWERKKIRQERRERARRMGW